MGIINPSLPVPGLSSATEDPKVLEALTEILGVINGAVEAANLADGSVTLAKMATSARGIRIVSVANDVVANVNQPFTVTTGGVHLIVAQTTAIGNVSTGASLSGAQLLVDGSSVAIVEQMLDSSSLGKHLLYPLLLAAPTLSAGSHNIRANSAGFSTIDGNDRLSYVIVETRS